MSFKWQSSSHEEERPLPALGAIETPPAHPANRHRIFSPPLRENSAAERFRSSYLLLIRRPATADVIALASDEARIVGG